MRVGSKLRPSKSLLFVGASLLATAAAAAPLPTLPGFGPLRVGMSLEEIRAATPDVTWTTGRPLKYSGQPTEFTADGVMIAERAFTARVSARHHGAYALSMEHVYAAPDADHCEQTARAIFAVIEPQTGPMQSPGELIRGEEVEPLGARSNVKLSQVLSMADYKPISRAKLKGRKPARRWLRATTDETSAPGSRHVILEDETASTQSATFAMDFEQEAVAEACRIRLEATRTTATPPLSSVPFAALTAIQTPSISRRHFEMSRLAISVTLPASGIELNVRCKVDRDSGRTRDCWATDSSLASGTASRLARAYQFDMSKLAGLDRDDPQPVLVDIPVRMTPADIRELKGTDQAVPVTQAGFRWATRAPAHVLEQLYPRRALRAEEQTNVALVCQVQEDYSSVCAPAAQDPRPAPDFEWAALEIITYYRAEPKTIDGRPTPGIPFLQNLQFRLQ